jgi:hypothetical protein
MTLRNGNHCYGYRCTCGATGSGYPSESAAARAERHHAERNPIVHKPKADAR